MPGSDLKLIDQYLSEGSLGRLKAQYKRNDLYDAFKPLLLRVYRPTKALADAIEENFFYREDPRNPNDDELASPDPGLLTIRERELCLIMILAAERERYNLAVHIYLALMEHVTPKAIANTIYLAGIYAGIPSLVDGLQTAIATLVELEKRASDPTNDLSAGKILGYLREPFPSS